MEITLEEAGRGVKIRGKKSKGPEGQKRRIEPILREILFCMEQILELIDAIRQRRSVKHYDPDHSMSDEELRHLLSLALLSPSSFNMQQWRIIAVRDPAVKERLCAASWNQRQVKEASLDLVIACNLCAHRDLERCYRDVPPEVQSKMIPMIQGFYEGKDALIRDEAARSAGILGMTLMLLAKDMGYDSCPMIGFDPRKVAEILGLPEDHPALLMLTIGKALKPAHPRSGLLDLEEVVRLEKYDGEKFR